MAHFAPVTTPSTAKPFFIPTYPRKTVFSATTHSDQVRHVQRRRSIALGLASVVAVGLRIGGGDDAKAAGRRPPPPTEEKEKEKKDPNMNGVVAKVLASKKRREAMKESMAKLREKGKPIQNPSP